MKKPLILTALLCAMLSCGGGVESQMDSLMAQEISLPRKAQTTFAGKDTVIQDYFDSELKMVVYSDSLSCNSCALKGLYAWGDLVEYAKGFDGKLKFYFIFNPPHNENIRIPLRNALLPYPMLLDSEGEFSSINPHLPANRALHTFLLDKDNNVVLVGSPLNNPKIGTMFKDIVEKELGEI